MQGLMGTINIQQHQEYIYSVEILALRDREYDWSTRSYSDWVDYPEGKVVSIHFFGTARAARNYGSYVTGGVKTEYDGRLDRYVEVVDPNKTKTYRVKRIPIALGEGVGIPKLKKLAD